VKDNKYVSLNGLSFFLNKLNSKFTTESFVENKIDGIYKMLETIGIDALEPLEDDIPKVFINGTIPTTKDEVSAEMTYVSKTLSFNAYIEIKCQGNSSMSYPKKNFTIKLFEDAEHTSKKKINFKGWGKQNKFCLKANWIDISHLRNVVSAQL
jgi:hypothetical protein